MGDVRITDPVELQRNHPTMSRTTGHHTNGETGSINHGNVGGGFYDDEDRQNFAIQHAVSSIKVCLRLILISHPRPHRGYEIETVLGKISHFSHQPSVC